MELKIQEDRELNFRLYIKCPVCASKGRDTMFSYWEHYGCNGDIYVDAGSWLEYGVVHFKCRKCGISILAENCDYYCPVHSNSPTECIGLSPRTAASCDDEVIQEVIKQMPSRELWKPIGFLPLDI